MQPAPIGAQCAQHPGIPASEVCVRCGNFMCGSCSERGAQSQCPTCRAKTADSFPFNADASLSDLWSHSVEVFKRDPTNVIVGSIVFFGITMAGSVVANIISTVVNSIAGANVDQTNPLRDLGKFALGIGIAQVVSTLVQVVVQAIALSGYYRLLMDLLIGRKADVARMFSKMKDVSKFVVLQVLMFCLVTLPLIAFMAVVVVAALGLSGFDWSHPTDFRPEALLKPAILGLFAGSWLLLMVVGIMVLPVSMFSLPELLVGNCTPVEALKRAWQLGDGQRARVLGYSLVMGLVIFAGVLACCFGVLVAMPVSYMLVLALFLSLRNSSSLPPADHS